MLTGKKRLALNRRGQGPFTLPEIVLYILSAVMMVLFIFVVRGYAANTVPNLVVTNEEQTLSNYAANAIISLPNWDGNCGCLAKSTITTEGEIIYPGLIPEYKLNKLAGGSCAGKNFCSIPYVVNAEHNFYASITVYDFEDKTTWEISPSVSRTVGPLINRLIAIEHADGRVHAGKISIRLNT